MENGMRDEKLGKNYFGDQYIFIINYKSTIKKKNKDNKPFTRFTRSD